MFFELAFSGNALIPALSGAVEGEVGTITLALCIIAAVISLTLRRFKFVALFFLLGLAIFSLRFYASIAADFEKAGKSAELDSLGSEAAVRPLGHVEVTSPWAYLRQEAKESSYILLKVQRGTKLRLLSEGDGWYKVNIPEGSDPRKGVFAYISKTDATIWSKSPKFVESDEEIEEDVELQRF